MFGPIYAAAFRHGIAPSAIDRSMPYAIGWALKDWAGGEPESAEDLISLAAEREARR